MNDGFRRILFKTLAFAAICFAAGFAFCESVTITGAKQRFPWNGIVDVRYRLNGLSQERLYYLEFAVKNPDGNVFHAWTNRVDQDGTFVERWNVTNTHGTNVDCDVSIAANLIAVAAPDLDTGTVFQPGDYKVFDMVAMTVTDVKGVSDAGYFNSNEYKLRKMVFRKVPAGSCWEHGTTGDNGADPGNLTIFSSDYYIAIFEMTIGQYYYAVSQTENDSTLPAINTWYGFRGYNNWPTDRNLGKDSVIGKFNQRLPSGYRLDMATRAQWERACRAGTRTLCFWGDGLITDYAWCASHGYAHRAVGQLKPNAWGLYDINGGAWEWCLDWYGNSIVYGLDPVGPVSGSLRALLGGSSGANAGNASCTSNFYGADSPSVGASYDYGTRLVLTEGGRPW